MWKISLESAKTEFKQISVFVVQFVYFLSGRFCPAPKLNFAWLFSKVPQYLNLQEVVGNRFDANGLFLLHNPSHIL